MAVVISRRQLRGITTAMFFLHAGSGATLPCFLRAQRLFTDFRKFVFQLLQAVFTTDNCKIIDTFRLVETPHSLLNFPVISSIILLQFLTK
jgi:hypothetical protein